MVSAKLSLFDWLLSSGEGTELSGFLKWNLISLNWNKLTPMTGICEDKVVCYF